jgi:hypothetical protein
MTVEHARGRRAARLLLLLLAGSTAQLRQQVESGLHALHGAERGVVGAFSESLSTLREAVGSLQRQYAAEQRRLHAREERRARAMQAELAVGLVVISSVLLSISPPMAGRAGRHVRAAAGHRGGPLAAAALPA